MALNYTYHKDKEILKWASYYTNHCITLMEMEERYQVAHSTIWWCFRNRLPLLDVQLYDRVLETLDYNYRNKPIHRHDRKGGRR